MPDNKPSPVRSAALDLAPFDAPAMVCRGCSNGAYDVLRSCPKCGRTAREKRDLRAALYGTDVALDALLA